jgi:rhamnosyltransferase
VITGREISGNMSIDELKIAGVVVLYNPGKVLTTNVNTYLNFIHHLFIIDNSEKQNLSLLGELVNSDKVSYHFNNSNLGIASALNLGIEKALGAGYSYLLTMDQDSQFEDDALDKLISEITTVEYIGIYTPFHKNKFLTNLPQSNKIEEVSDVMTSGNILNLSVVNKIGKFTDEYFIDYVDIEYCLRLRKNGYKILRINKSILNHNEANLSRRVFFGKTVYPPNHSAIRWYYKIRNFHYLRQKYSNDFPEYFVVEKKNVRNNILKVLIFEKNKIDKIKMMIKGYMDYRKNITGRMSF